MSKEQEAATMFVERQQLDKAHKFDAGEARECCPKGITEMYGLFGLHCKSLEHVCNLLEVDRELVTSLLLELKIKEVINPPVTAINDISAKRMDNTIALPDVNRVKGEVLCWVKSDPTDHTITFHSEGKVIAVLNKIFDQVSFITYENRYLLVEEYLKVKEQEKQEVKA